MARYHTCDLHGDKLIEPEVSTLRITGPLATILGKRELHVGKPGAYDLAELFHHVVARPEGMEVDLAARRRAIETGSPAGSSPPKGRGSKSMGKSNRART